MIPTKTIKLIVLVVVGYLVVRWWMNRKPKGAPYTAPGTGVVGSPPGLCWGLPC